MTLWVLEPLESVGIRIYFDLDLELTYFSIEGIWNSRVGQGSEESRLPLSCRWQNVVYSEESAGNTC